MDEARTQMQIMVYLFNKKETTTKQDSWQAWQGRTGHDKAGTGYTQCETMTNWHRTAHTRRL